MRILPKILNLFILFLVLTGCVDSGERFNPTDPDTVFTLFPSDYFTIGYRETYDLSGFDNNAITQLGVFSVEPRPQLIFNGELSIPVLITFQVTDTLSGSFSITTNTEYFSTDPNDRRNLGFTNTLTGIPPLSAPPAAIPAAAKIGDSGAIGTYIDVLGNETIKSWQLADGGDGRARLVFFSTERDSFGFRLSSIEERYLIEQNGERISVSLRFFNANSILTLSLSGDKTP